jgi:sugar phosphate isomerase/epimerase
MQPALSTYVLFHERLHPSHLDAFAAAGARSIELFAARHHFDYTDRSAVKEIASWFNQSDVIPTLHQPISADTRWSRHSAPTLNLAAPEKSRRIEAQDEIKRALETAELIPLSTITLHLGLAHSPWDEATLEHALTAIEHLKAFAVPLGVRLLLETLNNDIATPQHLLDILRIGHFEKTGIALDLGHAHLAPNQHTDGILPALELLRPRLAAIHLHDNDTSTDQHQWPFHLEQQGIDGPTVLPLLQTLPPTTPFLVEIAHDPAQPLEQITKNFTHTLDHIRRQAESPGAP